MISAHSPIHRSTVPKRPEREQEHRLATSHFVLRSYLPIYVTVMSATTQPNPTQPN